MQNNRFFGFNQAGGPYGPRAMFFNLGQFDRPLGLLSQHATPSSNNIQNVQFTRPAVNLQQSKPQLRNGLGLSRATSSSDRGSSSSSGGSSTNGSRTSNEILAGGQAGSSKAPEELVSYQRSSSEDVSKASQTGFRTPAGMKRVLKCALPHGIYRLEKPPISVSNAWIYLEANTTALDCLLSFFKFLDWGCTAGSEVLDSPHDWRCSKQSTVFHGLYSKFAEKWDRMMPIDHLAFKYEFARSNLADNPSRAAIIPDPDVDAIWDQLFQYGTPSQEQLGYKMYCGRCSATSELAIQQEIGTFSAVRAGSIEDVLRDTLYNTSYIQQSIHCIGCSSTAKEEFMVYPVDRIKEPCQLFIRMRNCDTLGDTMPNGVTVSVWSPFGEVETWTWQWVATIAECRIDQDRYSFFHLLPFSSTHVGFYDPGAQQAANHRDFGRSLILKTAAKGREISKHWRPRIICLELKRDKGKKSMTLF